MRYRFGTVLFLLLALYAVVQITVDIPWHDVIAKSQSVAVVNGKHIGRPEFAEALRALVWRRGEDWKTLSFEERAARRNEALEGLIESELVRASEVSSDSQVRGSDEAFQQFAKQFEGNEWKARAALQGLDEAGLRRIISGELRDIKTVEASLSSSPAAEAEAHAWYESHKGTLTIPERVHASQIFITRHDKENPNREPEIAEIARKLSAHEATFAKLAAKHSDDERSKLVGGDLGWFSRDWVPHDFADVVFTLQPGQMSAPFPTGLGWHIVLVDEKRPARRATFEEVKDEVTAKLDDERRQIVLKSWIQSLRSSATIKRYEDRIRAMEPAGL